jgi:hypothetical protein
VGYSSVNGLPVYDQELFERRLLMVKIDNAVAAQPQSGIQLADAMVELVVVHGTTRFIAMFHYSDAEYLGPIRSLRPIAAAVNGTMVNTGAQPWVTGMAIERDIPRVTFYPSIMYRIPERSLPNNVYGSTFDFREFADDRGFPDEAPTPWLPFGDPPLPQYPAQNVTLTWGQGVNDVEWRYNSDTRTYERWVRGDYQEWLDEEGERGTIDAEVLIVISGRFYIAHAPVNAPGSRTPVPAIDTVGSGRAWVFAKGGGWEGTWERDSEREPFRFLDVLGNAATVPPGRLWVSLLPSELVEFEGPSLSRRVARTPSKPE